MKKKKILSTIVVLLLVVIGVAATSFAENSKEVDQLSYFELTGATAELKEESLFITLTEETATIQFKNVLAASGFSFLWNGVNDRDEKLNQLTVILTDSQDEDCSVKVNFIKLNKQNTVVRYNDETRSYLTEGATNLKNDTPISLKFNENTNTFTDALEAYQMTANSCTNGNDFNGFASKGVNLKIVVTGKAGATFSINAINEQPFGKNYAIDNVEPTLCIPTGQTNMVHNSIATLPKAAAFDVFSDETILKLTVQDPEGNVIKDESGTLLDKVDGNQEYRIKFSQYGTYRVVYIASDGINETRGMGYQINVKDKGTPVIQFKKEMTKKVTLGEEVVFPELKINDNTTGEFITWTNVLHPEGYMTCEKASFIPTTPGEYVITFCAQDESGNIGRLVTNIYVEGSSK